MDIKKTKLKGLYALIFVITFILGLIATGIFLIKPFETKTINANYFSVGGIDKNGNHYETDDTIYTKDLIGVEGFKITRNVTCDSEFELFFYDYKEDFLYSTGRLTTGYKVPDSIKLVEYLRIVIYPSMNGYKPVEFRITDLKISKYVNGFNIKTDKIQGVEPYENIFELDSNMYNKQYPLSYLTAEPEVNNQVNSTIIYDFDKTKTYYLFSPVCLDAHRVYYANANMKVYVATSLVNKQYSKLGENFYIYAFEFKESTTHQNYFAQARPRGRLPYWGL